MQKNIKFSVKTDQLFFSRLLSPKQRGIKHGCSSAPILNELELDTQMKCLQMFADDSGISTFPARVCTQSPMQPCVHSYSCVNTLVLLLSDAVVGAVDKFTESTREGHSKIKQKKPHVTPVDELLMKNILDYAKQRWIRPLNQS